MTIIHKVPAKDFIGKNFNCENNKMYYHVFREWNKIANQKDAQEIFKKM